MQRILLVVCTLVIFTSLVKAQKQLPDFSAEDLGKNKIRISWVNPFNEGCIQLNVQFSFDSVKNFRTIFATESPQLPQNGFIYTTPYTGKFYYRIFYILDADHPHCFHC